MKFRLLGPLEVSDQGRPVVLRGTKQRATLGFLLLQANRVVPTSRLLNALWGIDEAPTTARKILQNAVYGIRAVLAPRPAAQGPDTHPALLTQSPGYMIRVDPEQVDLHQFHQRIGEGRQRRAQGRPDAAATLLREGLELWRGPVLADLVEVGLEWPELAALQNTRLDVLEDYFDAQLACGRHYEVLPELETMVQAEPLRERACSQLMLALYRCGRQADALNLYSRVRTELVENLGLEPGRGLQNMQQAILTQDPTLTPAPCDELPGPATDDAPREAIRRATRMEADIPPEAAPHPGEDQTLSERSVDPDRRRVSVLAVSTRLAPSLAGGVRENLDDLLDAATLMVREQVERFGGTVTASIGSVSLALFGLDDPCEADAERAVLAALAVRDVFDVGMESTQLTVHAAVAVGEVLLRHHDPGDAPTVVGTVLDESHALLAAVTAGEVWVQDEVRQVTTTTVTYRQVADTPSLWQVTGRREPTLDAQDTDSTECCYELDVLRGLAKRTWHRSMPHLATVLGEAGTGKSRLLGDFALWASQLPNGALFLTGRTPIPRAAADSLWAQAQILSAYCGVRDRDGDFAARAALVRKVRSLFRSGPVADGMVSRLTPLIGGHTDSDHGLGAAVPPSVTLDAWREFFQEAARRRPLVLGIDDLHHAADFVLDAVEECAESASPGRLFVMVTAEPELLLRRPGWGGGKRHATTVTLDSAERITTEQLVEFLRSAARS